VETLFRICLSNTLVALGLGALAAAAGWLRLRPALVHGLWVLVLVKLVTPPLAVVPAAAGRAWSWSWPASAPARGPIARAPSTPSTSRKPAVEYGTWRYRTNIRPGQAAGRAVAAAARLIAAGRLSPPRVPAEPGVQRGPMTAGPMDWGRRLAVRFPPASQLLALAAWLGVATVWWGRTAWRFRRFRRLLRWARPAPAEVQRRARELAPRLGLRRTPEVWFVPAPISPMLWGLAARPRLLVPGALWDRLEPDQRAALLVHELAHFRRRDHWVRLLEVAATGLHWWNPLVWWARRALREAEERCCDAWVSSALPGRARDYALAIIETLDYLAGAPSPDPMGATGLTSASRHKERLAQILGGATAKPLSWPGTVVLLGLTIAALGMRPGWSPHRYFRAMDLGHLGAQGTFPHRLNALGQVVGQSATADWTRPNSPARNVPHCFRTAPDRPIDPATDDLSILVGARDELDDRAFAVDINNSAQVIVSLHRRPALAGAEETQRGFLVDGRRAIELDPGVGPQPAALNGAGLIAVNARRRRPDPDPERPATARPYQLSGWDTVGLRVRPDRPIDPVGDDIGHLGGMERYPNRWGYFTQISDINASGQVVGTSQSIEAMRRAFRTRPDRPIDPATDDLGSLTPSGSSGASAINDLGQVVGSAPVNETARRLNFWLNDLGQVVGMSELTGTSVHAFRTAPDRPIDPATDDLGTLGGPNSEAYGINNHGDVVGKSDNRDGEAHAFLFTEGRMIDLNACVDLPAGWALERASDINDRGQIIATAVELRENNVGRGRGYLLTPAPEPIPLAMLVVGAAMTTGLALRSRGAASKEAQPMSPRGQGPIPGSADRP
jgi:probable HAF family extracellular repeat protein